MYPANPTLKNKQSSTYDAIVVGSGISGGWAAKELCERGLKTLVLERGRNVEHVTDYPTALKSPWEFPNRLNNVIKDQVDNPVQSVLYNEGSKHFFVNDKEHPYIQEKPFSWIRGYQVGGRSLTWGRQCYRLSDLDFEANAKEGVAVDWPIRYKDLAPWYDYVERFVGISGRAEGLSHLPDGQFLPPMEFNCIETHFAQQIKSHYKDRLVTIARTANLTKGWNGRGPCQYRNLCARGCPFSGYFSSNSATLPVAMATGNLTLQPDSIVIEVLFDEQKNRATGVRVMDAHTKEVRECYAKIIFLNASTIATSALLLNSVSHRFPDGLGNSSGQVGRNLMDHFMMGGATGEYEGFKDKYYEGRRPIGIYVPRFRNLNAQTKQKDYLRGFGYQGDGERAEWSDQYKRVEGFGKDFKTALTQPGPWTMFIGAWGETLPYAENRIWLDKEQKDQWGLPLVRVFFEYHENEINMRKDIKESAEEMLQKSGFQKVQQFYYDLPPGSAVHEMGTARMGRDPKTSVLNGYNQMHDVKNVFITDGSCMTSSACQNPSLTYMALTARACDYAVSELKKLNL
ncbi:GMC oxidoreductase [Runella aurantiaca]|uniref:GMC family oxidoreductase n=1 Tax=Runella aurantiaca TaxID=2282308 RepID=A0A369IAA0_9BACT|nr:GMC family oxidoreductase [Runella aurantiaca]RDB06568.1 GMC family oxidoreductase [Runella aurantiaca]